MPTEPKGKGDPEGWEQVDTNGDGFIDAKEAQVIADNATKQHGASAKPITRTPNVWCLGWRIVRDLSKDASHGSSELKVGA